MSMDELNGDDDDDDNVTGWCEIFIWCVFPVCL